MKIGKHLEVLNGKEIKEIRKQLEKQFDFKGTFDFVFLRNNKDKLYVLNRAIEFINVEEFWVDSAGLYFAKVQPDGLRLTVEGSQLIGPFCEKNVISISPELKHEWLKGNDFEVDINEDVLIIVKSGNDFLGCAKVKNGKVLNSLSKSRRLHVVNEVLEE
ncbi:hypothetical protein K9L67_03890 [Candidatus Woesearchaeota archaeon]|nr:hypothetical protein [Candidatus Woesearchaeota archaeon]MCF7901343.1 hypothetical protein [Candidatus Woesearchaeota archaeon]MCF8014040.1 hypothetical protein [Candidatus Woesearchaeota archaeon]